MSYGRWLRPFYGCNSSLSSSFHPQITFLLSTRFFSSNLAMQKHPYSYSKLLHNPLLSLCVLHHNSNGSPNKKVISGHRMEMAKAMNLPLRDFRLIEPKDQEDSPAIWIRQDTVLLKLGTHLNAIIRSDSCAFFLTPSEATTLNSVTRSQDLPRGLQSVRKPLGRYVGGIPSSTRVSANLATIKAIWYSMETRHRLRSEVLDSLYEEDVTTVPDDETEFTPMQYDFPPQSMKSARSSHSSVHYPPLNTPLSSPSFYSSQSPPSVPSLPPPSSSSSTGETPRKNYETYPFEVLVMDTCFHYCISKISYRIDELELSAIPIFSTLSNHGESPSKDTWASLISLKNDCQDLETLLKRLHNMLLTVLKEDEDLNNMYLTDKKHGLVHSDGDHEKIELLLEMYLQSIESLGSEISTLKKKIEIQEQAKKLYMDTIRNAIMKYDLMLSIMAVILSSVTFISGLFGMNVKNHWEEEDQAFKYLSMGLIFGAGLCFGVVFLRMRGLGYWWKN